MRRGMPDDEDRAAAVSFAVSHGVRLAAEQFRVSERTIKRWKRQAESGRDPDLARRVKAEERERIRRRRDLLDQLFEVVARRALELAKQSNDLREIANLLEKVGNLRLSRDALADDDGRDRDTGEDPPPTENPEGPASFEANVRRLERVV